MKKILTIVTVSFLAFQLTSCKPETKKEGTTPPVEKTPSYSLKNAKNNINFIAYKTTGKIPVKGMFKEVDVLKGGDGNSIREAVNGTKFKIPINSIETKDNGRNLKIRKFFFDVMENTVSLTGKLYIEDDSIGTAEFTMNGVTKKIPFTYTIQDKVFSMDATMDVEKWNAESAIDSLNVACKDLHKGADGVSKTWSEVAINVISVFK